MFHPKKKKKKKKNVEYIVIMYEIHNCRCIFLLQHSNQVCNNTRSTSN